MSHLNKLKKLREKYPNDQEFGAIVAEYLHDSNNCCDDEENLFTAIRLDTEKHQDTHCKVRGKIINTKVI